MNTGSHRLEVRRRSANPTRFAPTAEAWEAKLAAYGSDYMSMSAANIQRRVAAVQQQLDNSRLWSAAPGS